MAVTERVSTVIRLRPELMERVKRHARRYNKSFNSFVEQVLDRETGLVFPKLPPGYGVSKEIMEMGGCCSGAPDAEALANDPKLAYLWGKYGRV